MTRSAATLITPTDHEHGWLPLDAAATEPVPLYDVAAIRRLEHAALAQLPAFTLMSRAGTAAARWLACHAPDGPLLLLAGPGNNGGDALVAATQLHRAGRAVQVWLAADPQRLPSDAATAWQQAQAAGVPSSVMADPDAAQDAPWPAGTAAIVDGLLGIGLNRPADGRMAWWIDQLNRAAL
ncbi:MAG: bifunctional ADP-dependent NAD(P)H-hydrate dehydratase/NAD(P)H-hydrate epimerase, partial [Cupriavidus sp.]|nr:bifunctional ADP-dependent NAD(P)H-hydrate dehydratase/NAD(P)H-hydrate epimerase [Cupriavidus sp.]